MGKSVYLKDDDELVMTGKQIREYKAIVEKETRLDIADGKRKNKYRR